MTSLNGRFAQILETLTTIDMQLLCNVPCNPEN